MWHKKQNNMIVPGQMMGPPPGSQAVHMENMIIPPPSGRSDVDFRAESSRKRKATPLDQQGFNISGSVSGYCLPREPNPQHNVSVLLGSNVQGNTLGVFSNQTFLTGEPNSFGHKFGTYQFRSLNNFPASWQTNGNFPKDAAVEKANKSCSSMQLQSFHQKGWSPLIKSPVGEILSVPNWQPQALNMVSQTEAYKSSSYLIPSNTFSEKAQAGPYLKDGMSFGHGNRFFKDNPTMEVHSTPSEGLISLDISQQRLIKSDKFDATLIGKMSFLEDSKFGSSFEVKQSVQILDTPGAKDISSVETGTLGAPCTEGKEIGRFYHNYEVQPGSSPSGMGLRDNLKDKNQDIGDGNVKIMKETEGSDMENVKKFSGEEMAPENAGSPSNILIVHGHRDDQSRGSLMVDGKVKSHAGKVTPIIVEKLWDGSLQLNASITVSAVAFFKSGEKVPEVNWPNFVEVKGKVKLEAFEKYIQELPRSRNRGLMVISLCWNAGSSKAGLTGMKEVAKGYKEGERVGFAQLSPGIDLYVCPRSDTIITILAKYGFFKGMAAVQDDQDSLIGCVVWRRNRTSNSVTKKSERKKTTLSEQPLNSCSDSAIQQSEERDSSLTQPARDSSPLVSVTGCTVLDSAVSTGIVNKNIQSSEVQLEVANSFTGANPMLTTSVPNTSFAISVGLQTAPHSESSSIQGPMGQFLQVEACLVHSAEPEKPGVSMELQRPILPALSEIIKHHRPAVDDDDLPEFDFKTACGVSQSPVSKPLLSTNNRNVLDAAPFDKKLQADGFRMYGLVPPVMPIVQPVTANCQRRSENSNFPGFSLDANQGIPPLKKLGEHQPQTFVLPLMEEKYIAKSSELLSRPGNVDSNQGMPQLKKLGERESHVSGPPLLEEKHALKSNEFLSRPGTVKPASGTAAPPSKNIWDDDDDMPEWCPPDLESQNQPPAGAITRSSIPHTFQHPKSTLEKLPPGPPRPLRPSYQVPIPPPIFPQGLPHGYHCPITITVKPAQARSVGGYVQRGPSSSSEFISNPNLRPQFNVFEVKPPMRPAGWRGWRH